MTWTPFDFGRPRAGVRYYSSLADLERPLGRQVVLSPAARRTIRTFAAFDGAGELETGGILFGAVDGERVLVTHATGPGDGAVRTATSVQFSRDVFRAGLPGTVQVGDWHTHTDEDVPELTRDDVEAWRLGRACAPGGESYVGLVVTRGERGWGRPALSAWIVAEVDGDATRRQS